MKSARNNNHKAVVDEDKRNKTGAEDLKEVKRKRYEAAKEAGTLPSEEEKLMSTTAASATEKSEKQKKKDKRSSGATWAGVLAVGMVA